MAGRGGAFRERQWRLEPEAAAAALRPSRAAGGCGSRPTLPPPDAGRRPTSRSSGAAPSSTRSTTPARRASRSQRRHPRRAARRPRRSRCAAVRALRGGWTSAAHRVDSRTPRGAAPCPGEVSPRAPAAAAARGEGGGLPRRHPGPRERADTERRISSTQRPKVACSCSSMYRGAGLGFSAQPCDAAIPTRTRPQVRAAPSSHLVKRRSVRPPRLTIASAGAYGAYSFASRAVEARTFLRDPSVTAAARPRAVARGGKP